jgi:hypothetical protein
VEAPQGTKKVTLLPLLKPCISFFKGRMNFWFVKDNFEFNNPNQKTGS